jgi:hypothetical protein
MLLFEHCAMMFIYLIAVYVSFDPDTYIVRIRFAFQNRVWHSPPTPTLPLPLHLPHKHTPAQGSFGRSSIVRPPVLSLFVRSSDRSWFVRPIVRSFVRSFVQIIFFLPLCYRNSDRSFVRSFDRSSDRSWFVRPFVRSFDRSSVCSSK